MSSILFLAAIFEKHYKDGKDSHLHFRHIVPVARLEAFRALELSRLESFRAIKINARLESFRPLRLSNLAMASVSQTDSTLQTIRK